MIVQQHITMFKLIDGVSVRCVISGEFKSQFESDGFVDHIEKVGKKNEIDELRQEAKSLGVKGWHLMGIGKLKAAINDHKD